MLQRIQPETETIQVLLFQTEIVYLAHHVSSKGIRPSEENVCTIVEFLMLETYTEVRVFCGLVGHYCHFLRNFAHL